MSLDPSRAEHGTRTGFFGHPAGLRTLFFTEMWERFSYYGMRALLVLFMVDQVVKGGLGLDDRTATAIYGLYTGAVYLVTLPGGWVADRWLGQQRAIWHGGVIIMLGHFTLALPGFFAHASRELVLGLGLVLIVAGSGLLKPNISAIVGQLYPEGGARRDAGFSVFYMGINLGAMLGPLVCSYLGENVNWHYGFGAAGIGMLFGLVQFGLTRSALGTAGLQPGSAEAGNPGLRSGTEPGFGGRYGVVVVWLAVLVCVLVVSSFALGVVQVDPVKLAHGAGAFIVALALAFFTWLLLFGGLTADERRRVLVVASFFLGAALFWSGFEQAGSTLNLFAERYTDRSFLGKLFTSGEHPAGYYQSVNALFIILGAPVFAWLWVSLAARKTEPSAPAKFAAGLLLLALGFGVMAWASLRVLHGTGKVLPTWLIATYLLHTAGELCLSPIGLSWVTKLSPPRYLGQMMGTWFMGSALGNLVGGLVAGQFGKESVEQMPMRFLLIVAVATAGGLVFLCSARALQRMIGSVK